MSQTSNMKRIFNTMECLQQKQTTNSRHNDRQNRSMPTKVKENIIKPASPRPQKVQIEINRLGDHWAIVSLWNSETYSYPIIEWSKKSSSNLNHPTRLTECVRIGKKRKTSSKACVSILFSSTKDQRAICPIDLQPTKNQKKEYSITTRSTP